MSGNDAELPEVNGATPTLIAAVAGGTPLTITRRAWLGKLAEWATKGAVIKQVATLSGGAVSGGFAVYGYLEPRLNALSEKDMVVRRDTTEVWLNPDGSYIDVKVSRAFSQEAVKSGYYKYQRVCDGDWIKDECSMSLQRVSGSQDPVHLAVEKVRETDENGHESDNEVCIIQPLDGKPISLSKGDSLEVKLVSEEKIEKVKGGYRLRLNAQFTKTSFTLHCPTAGFSAKDVQCIVYAEKQAQELHAVDLERATTLHNCNKGLEYLISWVGRSVQA